MSTSKFVETRLRDKSGRVFLDCANLKGRKTFTKFNLSDQQDMETISSDEVVGDVPAPAPKPAPVAAKAKTTTSVASTKAEEGWD